MAIYQGGKAKENISPALDSIPVGSDISEGVAVVGVGPTGAQAIMARPSDHILEELLVEAKVIRRHLDFITGNSEE